MPSESSADVKFEIGHVLFIDMVGYPKLLITEKSQQLQTLRRSFADRSNFGLRKLKDVLCAYHSEKHPLQSDENVPNSLILLPGYKRWVAPRKY